MTDAEDIRASTLTEDRNFEPSRGKGISHAAFQESASGNRISRAVGEEIFRKLESAFNSF